MQMYRYRKKGRRRGYKTFFISLRNAKQERGVRVMIIYMGTKKMQNAVANKISGTRERKRLQRKFETLAALLLARSGGTRVCVSGRRATRREKGSDGELSSEEESRRECARVSMSPRRRASAICAFIRTKHVHKREVKTMPSFLLLPRAKPRQDPRLSSLRLLSPVSPCPDLATLSCYLGVCACHSVLSLSLSLSVSPSSCFLPQRNGANIFFPLAFRVYTDLD